MLHDTALLLLMPTVLTLAELKFKMKTTSGVWSVMMTGTTSMPMSFVTVSGIKGTSPLSRFSFLSPQVPRRLLGLSIGSYSFNCTPLQCSTAAATVLNLLSMHICIKIVLRLKLLSSTI